MLNGKFSATDSQRSSSICNFFIGCLILVVHIYCRLTILPFILVTRHNIKNAPANTFLIKSSGPPGTREKIMATLL